MSEQRWARDALRSMGVQKPSADLIENFIRANIAEERMERATPMAPTPPGHPPRARPLQTERPPQPQAQQPRPKPPRGYSKSNLEPALRETGTLEKQRGIRKSGRPRIVATWFDEVARTMAADGTSLRQALRQHGITLDDAQIRALRRSKEFRKMHQEACAEHQKDLCQKRRTSEEQFRRAP